MSIWRMIFPDMPWMIGDRSGLRAATQRSSQRIWPARANRRGRLYAFGSDAYRLIPTLRNPQSIALLS